MIRHPTVGVNAGTGALQCMSHDVIEQLAIGVFEEDVVSMIATCGHMVDGTRRVQPG